MSLDRLDVAPAAFGSDLFTNEEIDAMTRHVKLAAELRGCRYFTEQERTMSGTVDADGTTNFDMSLPDAGATRDMLGVLRQLFGDNERGSFTKIVAMLREHADRTSPEGQALLDTLERFEKLREGVLRIWDMQGGADASPQPPLTVFLDWMYGEYLHSDADKAKRIAELNHFRLYEWQFHWVSDRLSALFWMFSGLVSRALEVASTK